MGRVQERAVAVALHDDRLLVIKRMRQGRRYAVLPGGGVEPGESAADAVLRELGEETGLTGVIERRLWTRSDDDRPAAYFLVAVPELVDEAAMAISGPEVERQSVDNSYEPGWIRVTDLDEENLQPAGIRSLIRQLVT